MLIALFAFSLAGAIFGTCAAALIVGQSLGVMMLGYVLGGLSGVLCYIVWQIGAPRRAPVAHAGRQGHSKRVAG